MKVYESESPLFEDRGLLRNLIMSLKLWWAWRRLPKTKVNKKLKSRIGSFKEVLNGK